MPDLPGAICAGLVLLFGVPAFIFIAGVFGRARDKELERQNRPETHGPVFYLTILLTMLALAGGLAAVLGVFPKWQ